MAGLPSGGSGAGAASAQSFSGALPRERYPFSLLLDGSGPEPGASSHGPYFHMGLMAGRIKLMLKRKLHG